MAHIRFNSVSIRFPIYNAESRSLKTQLIKAATGNRLQSNRGRIEVQAINQINLKINDGDRIALLGHNGAGKSTLLRLLNGVYTPTEGQTEISGRLGSLIDISLGIDPEATGRENIMIRGRLLGMSKQFLQQQAEQIIAFSELGPFIDMPLRTYSSGMQLRLAFAVSTLCPPEILLMDEWLSVGDERFQRKAEKRIEQLIAASRILVIATHSKPLALTICNRAIWLKNGNIQMDGDVTEVCHAYFKEENNPNPVVTGKLKEEMQV